MEPASPDRRRGGGVRARRLPRTPGPAAGGGDRRPGGGVRRRHRRGAGSARRQRARPAQRVRLPGTRRPAPGNDRLARDLPQGARPAGLEHPDLSLAHDRYPRRRPGRGPWHAALAPGQRPPQPRAGDHAATARVAESGLLPHRLQRERPRQLRRRARQPPGRVRDRPRPARRRPAGGDRGTGAPRRHRAIRSPRLAHRQPEPCRHPAQSAVLRLQLPLAAPARRHDRRPRHGTLRSDPGGSFWAPVPRAGTATPRPSHRTCRCATGWSRTRAHDPVRPLLYARGDRRHGAGAGRRPSRALPGRLHRPHGPGPRPAPADGHGVRLGRSVRAAGLPHSRRHPRARARLHARPPVHGAPPAGRPRARRAAVARGPLPGPAAVSGRLRVLRGHDGPHPQPHRLGQPRSQHHLLRRHRRRRADPDDPSGSPGRHLRLRPGGAAAADRPAAYLARALVSRLPGRG